MGKRSEKYYRISAILFTLAGLIWVMSGKLPIGMMNVCVGMMFFALSARKKEDEANNAQETELPNKPDAGDF
jgi:hypothetical protein